MSDSFITIVPRNVDKVQVKELAIKVVDHLIEKRIINRELTDCTLGNNGHPLGDNFKDAIEGDDYGLKDIWANGLEIKTTREVFHNGGNGIDEIKCPDCSTNIIETDWGQAIDEWINESDLHKVTCPNCNAEYSITDYVFNPEWCFGYLGFTFWNWPNLKDNFIKELEQILERRVTIIYGQV